MGSRILGAIIRRLTAPPRALQAHALLVLAAAVLIAPTGSTAPWFGPVVVSILLWALLRGSRFVRWVHLVGLLWVLMQAAGIYSDVINGPTAFSIFVDPPRFAVVTAAVAIAWLLLFLPSVRLYCSDDAAPRGTFVFALGVYFVSSFPVMALGFDARVPSSAAVYEGDGTFMGGDRGRHLAFFVFPEGNDTCLRIVGRNFTSDSCHHRLDPDRSQWLHRSYEGVLADVVPEGVERVDVVTPAQGTRKARLLESPRAGVDVYYLLDAPPRGRVVGYDSNGAVVYRGRLSD